MSLLLAALPVGAAAYTLWLAARGIVKDSAPAVATEATVDPQREAELAREALARGEAARVAEEARARAEAERARLAEEAAAAAAMRQQAQAERDRIAGEAAAAAQAAERARIAQDQAAAEAARADAQRLAQQALEQQRIADQLAADQRRLAEEALAQGRAQEAAAQDAARQQAERDRLAAAAAAQEAARNAETARAARLSTISTVACERLRTGQLTWEQAEAALRQPDMVRDFTAEELSILRGSLQRCIPIAPPAPPAPPEPPPAAPPAPPMPPPSPTEPARPVSVPPAQQSERDRLVQASVALRDYLIATPTIAAFGTADMPSPRVAAYQRIAKIDDDGVLGPQVRAAGRSVGVEFPARPSAAAPQASRPVVQAAPAPAPPIASPPAVASAPAPVAPPGYDPALARQLAPQVASSVRGKKYGYDRALTSRFQTAAGLTSDGLYGGGTRGALIYFGATQVPNPLFKPTATTQYVPPGGVVPNV